MEAFRPPGYRRSWSQGVPGYSNWFLADAPTDGILTGHVRRASGVSGTNASLIVYSVGRYNYFTPPALPGMASFSIPLRKDQAFYVCSEVSSDVWRYFMTLTLFWFPLGQSLDLRVHSAGAPAPTAETAQEPGIEPVPQEFVPLKMPEDIPEAKPEA